MPNAAIRVDAHKVRRLRDELSLRYGHDATQEHVAKKAGVARPLISYMESPSVDRGFSFETVYLVARFYREVLNDPKITADYLAKEIDRLRPIPHVAEDPATYNARSQLLDDLYDKITDLSPATMAALSEYLDFLLSQQRHQPEEEPND